VSISGSTQTAALGSAISGAVAAGAFPDFASGMAKMTSLNPRIFTPDPQSQRVYNELYKLYHRLHDAFGVKGESDDLSDVMKKLLALRDEVRNA
jgi:L-ribulokinase